MAAPSTLHQNEVQRAFAGGLIERQAASPLAPLLVETAFAGEKVPFGLVNSPPKARKDYGPRDAQAMVAHRINLENDRWHIGWEIDGDDWRRDQTGESQRAVDQLVDAIVMDRDETIIDMLKNGDVAGNTAYDGVTFFGTHTDSAGNSFDNDIDFNDVSALNVGTATAPTAEEAVDAILGVVGWLMENSVDDAGRQVNKGARRFAVISPTADIWAPFFTATTANNLSGGETNVLVAGGFQFEHVFLPELDWTTEFAVARIDAPRRPLIFNVEDPIQLMMLDESSERFIESGKLLWRPTGVWGTAYGEYRTIVKATLS